MSQLFHAEFFKVVNEIENEDLAVTLETIVNKLGVEIVPYAGSLFQNLVSYLCYFMLLYSIHLYFILIR